MNTKLVMSVINNVRSDDDMDVPASGHISWLKQNLVVVGSNGIEVPAMEVE